MKVLKGCVWGIFVLAALSVILIVVVVVANLYTAGRWAKHELATQTAVARHVPNYSPPVVTTAVVPGSNMAPDIAATVSANFNRQVAEITAARSATAAAVDAAFKRLFATSTPSP